MPSLPLPADSVAAVVLEVLARGARLTVTELRDAVEAAGVALGDDPEGALADALAQAPFPLSASVLRLSDGTFTTVPVFLDQVVATHRLTEGELAGHHLLLSPDLAALAPLVDLMTPEDRVLDGHPFTPLVVDATSEALAVGLAELPDGTEVWQFEDGVWHGRQPGDAVVLRWGGDGFVLDRADELGPVDALSDHLLQVLTPHGEPLTVPELLWSVAEHAPDVVRTPTLPLTEVFDALGLSTHAGLVAAPGVDVAGWWEADLVAQVGQDHDLHPDEALTVIAWHRALRGHDGLPPQHRDLLAGFVPHAANVRVPWVAEVLLEQAFGQASDSPEALATLTEALEPLLPSASLPNLWWLRAKSLEALGRVQEAEDLLRRADAQDPEAHLALFDLARYASDRGDAPAALSLLRRAKVPADDSLVLTLERFLPVERTDLGRNDPCWCGSGRKYKVCHRGQETLPLEQRGMWLYTKVQAVLADQPWRSARVDLAEILAGPDASSEHVQHEHAHPLSGDLLLFEGGALAAFLAHRGSLLPADEQAMAAQWLTTRRAVHRVESTDPSVGLVLRNMETDELVELSDTVASSRIPVGLHVATQVLPVGSTWRVFGGFEPIEKELVEAYRAALATDPDSATVAQFFSDRRGGLPLD